MPRNRPSQYYVTSNLKRIQNQYHSPQSSIVQSPGSPSSEATHPRLGDEPSLAIRYECCPHADPCSRLRRREPVDHHINHMSPDEYLLRRSFKWASGDRPRLPGKRGYMKTEAKLCTTQYTNTNTYLDRVLVREEMNNLKRMCNDSHGKQLLPVVAALHH